MPLLEVNVGGAKSSAQQAGIMKEWLGDLDSNQDSRSQSPMFYR